MPLMPLMPVMHGSGQVGALWLAGPHRSLLDGPAAAWFARKHGVHVLFGVDPDYACHPVWKRVLNAYGWFTGCAMVPLYHDRPQSMRRLLKHLREGGTVCIFPEGRIASGEHAIHQPGADWLARKSGAEVVEIDLAHCVDVGKIRITRVSN
jgi:1-acyl-sn-glycerol-3-phosphate acyltransferase